VPLRAEPGDGRVLHRVALVTRIELEASMIAARALSSLVTHLYVAGRQNPGLEELRNGAKGQHSCIHFVQHEPCDPSSCDQLFGHIKARHEHLDVFVTSTSNETDGDLFELDRDTFNRSLELNLVAPWLALKGAIEVMDQTGIIVLLTPHDAQAPGRSSPLLSAERDALKLMSEAATMDCAGLGRPIRLNRLSFDRHAIPSIEHAVRALTDEMSSFMTGAELILSGPLARERK
jgi:NAD(P)-dependent dehydrogenase (short-subunit alcohol dehydrogenase family)